MKKIEILYPDGRQDLQSNVSNTYRKAIEYVGLAKVRALGIERNSINIVSTRDEMKKGSGKKESHAIARLNKEADLGICTQFATEDKYKILVEINSALNAGLRIKLIDVTGTEMTETFPEEESDKEICEGLLKEYKTTRYERSPLARRLCLKHYGDKATCQVCGFDFEKTYGKRDSGKPYIEIHHINPLAAMSAKDGNHKVDFAKDLIPVCANCHRMLHFLKKETLHPSELKKYLQNHK